jgi:crotonobetainyl-CoA:carnitine CoA-transferase CaiB-like acyl-CoA transferase
MTGVRVLDLSQDIAGSYCARLIATMGGDVIKVEPPSGDPIRRQGPFKDDLPNWEAAGTFSYNNAGKKSITLDLATVTGRDLFLRLVRTADVVVESFMPASLDELGLGYEALKAVNSRIILVSITPFGQTGPYNQYRATEIGIHAISGEMAAAGDVTRPPLKKGRNVAQYLGGLHGVLGLMAALIQRERTSEGRHIDVSLSEGFTSIIGSVLRDYAYNGDTPRRRQQASWLNSIRPCKDGLVMIFTSGRDWWPRLVEVLGPLAPDAASPSPPETPEEQGAWLKALDTWLMARTKAEVFSQAQEMRLPFGYIATAPDHLANPQLAHRGFFETVDHPVMGEVTTMGLPFLFNEERYATGRAPLLGEHNTPVYCEDLGLSQRELVNLRQTGVI